MTEAERQTDAYDAGFDDGYAEGVVDGRDELKAENERLRGALGKISRAESGMWGRIAHEALRGTHARR